MQNSYAPMKNTRTKPQQPRAYVAPIRGKGWTRTDKRAAQPLS